MTLAFFHKEWGERERELLLLMLSTVHMNVKIFIRSQSLHPAVQQLLLLVCRQYFITVLLILLSASCVDLLVNADTNPLFLFYQV